MNRMIRNAAGIAIKYNKSLIKTRFETRYSTYYGSPFICDIEKPKIKYKMTNDPNDWKYVERLLPPETVPQPIVKDYYPSGWKPQANNLKDRPYFIPRTKNHMMPVYLEILDRGRKRLTNIRKIQGDIWQLEEELRNFLQKDSLKPIRTQVNEMNGYICIHGDHVNAIKYYLLNKGY